jgi:hypothetical protein
MWSHKTQKAYLDPDFKAFGFKVCCIEEGNNVILFFCYTLNKLININFMAGFESECCDHN